MIEHDIIFQATCENDVIKIGHVMATFHDGN